MHECPRKGAKIGYLEIVTLSSQLASTTMRLVKITILRLFVATAVNIKGLRTGRGKEWEGNG